MVKSLKASSISYYSYGAIKISYWTQLRGSRLTPGGDE